MLPDDPRAEDDAVLPRDPDPTDPYVPVDAPPPVLSARGTAAGPRGAVFAVAVVLVAVLAGGALFMSGYSLGRGQSLAPGTPADEQQAWKPFWDVYSAIVNRYPLEDLERRTLIEGAIRGLVDAVGDPYSSYLSPTDFEQTIKDITGEFEGIGAEIGTVDAQGNTVDCGTFGQDCQLVIIAPLDGSPAERAELRPGDVILAVDGLTLDGLTPDEARDRIRGEAGTEVVLRIRRYEPPAGGPPDQAPQASPEASPRPPRVIVDELEVAVTRAKVQRREVTSRVLAGGTVGYVRLAGFSDAGANAFEAAMKAHVDAGIKKIVFDLRGNPGGFLLDARRVASVFIESGPVYWQEAADGSQLESDAAGGGVATDESIQVVLLIDRGSASASEIVAGALQDRGRATLVGETSFGKGTVQEWIGLEDLGGVRLTVWKWLTPDKRWIHHVGITPDVPVEVPADTPRGEDPVLDRALEILGAPTTSLRALLPAA